MKRFAIAAGAVILAGCGGSSGSGSTVGGGDGAANQFGPIETRGQIKGSPIVRDLGRIATVALAGVLTDVTYRPQGVPDNETAIVVATGNGDLEFYLESGEMITTMRPTGLDPRSYAGYPQWSKDGTKIYFLPVSDDPAAPRPGVQAMDVQTGAVSTVVAVNGIQFFRVSPDESKIVYTRIPTGETDFEVYVRGLSGGSTTRLTNNDVTDIGTCWMDNNDRVAIQSTGSGTNNTVVRQLSTGDEVDYDATPDNSLAPFGRDANGEHFLNAGAIAPASGGSVSQRFAVDKYSTVDFTLALNNRGPASISPDNTRWATVAADSVVTTERFPETSHPFVPRVAAGYIGAAWQPALGNTKFVGGGGKLGSTSAGFIATYRSGIGRKGLSSIVNWDCQTRSTSTVSDDATDTNAGTKTYVIEADRLTALRYGNRPLFDNISTVSSTGTANGAIVTVDSETGTVASILVYQETRGSKPIITKQGGLKIVQGSISSVWDAKGKNLAPSGTNRVTLSDKGIPTVN